MVFQNLSNTRRLALALVPGLVASVLGIVIVVYPFAQTPAWIWGNFLLYFALFGGLVMAPFITATTYRPGRLAALVIVTPTLGVLSSFISEDLASLGWGIYPNYFSTTFLFLLSTLMLGVLLSIVAPLKITFRVFMSIVLAGLIMGLATHFFVTQFLCIIFCDRLDNLPLLVPILLWPVLFCAAVIIGMPGRAPAADDFIQE